MLRFLLSSWQHSYFLCHHFYLFLTYSFFLSPCCWATELVKMIPLVCDWLRERQIHVRVWIGGDVHASHAENRNLQIPVHWQINRQPNVPSACESNMRNQACVLVRVWSQPLGMLSAVSAWHTHLHANMHAGVCVVEITCRWSLQEGATLQTEYRKTFLLRVCACFAAWWWDLPSFYYSNEAQMNTLIRKSFKVWCNQQLWLI